MNNEKEANNKEKMMGMQDNTNHPFFLNSKVKKSKDKGLKIRLQTLIKAKGMSEADFYKGLGYSKQVWYAMSWGIWETAIEQKVKIAKTLGVDSSVIWQPITKIIGEEK